MSIYLAVFLWACAVVAVILIAGLVHELTRPKPQPRPARPHGTCHVRGCGRITHERITRRDTGTPEWVCIGCRDEGTVLGYWDTDTTGVAS